MSKRAGPNPRRVAVRTLRAIERRQGFSNRILSEELERHPELERRDRALITSLVYGVLRQRTRLDALIDAFATRPAKLKGELREILRVATFEIVELERPLAIANAEAGKLAARIDPQRRLAGVITAILALVERDWPIFDVALQDGDPVDALVRRWSIPRWLASRWVAGLGGEVALARGRALAAVPDIDLRVDLGRTDAAAVAERLLDDHPGLRLVELPAAAGEQPQCLRVRGGGDLFYGPSYAAGLVSIQGLGSQQAVRVLDPQPGERVLDACAGMGTKTVQIAEHMRRRGQLVASDRSSARLAELAGQRARARLDGAGLDGAGLDADAFELKTLELDLTAEHGADDPAAHELRPASFDAVLLDAPCTGLGNLARHPELRWTRQAEGLGERSELQQALLRRCAALVRPGGRLVYAVCSLEPEEGEAIVDAFVAGPQGADFTVERRESWTPEDHASDGFWLARLRRS